MRREKKKEEKNESYSNEAKEKDMRVSTRTRPWGGGGRGGGEKKKQFRPRSHEVCRIPAERENAAANEMQKSGERQQFGASAPNGRKENAPD